VVCGGGGGGGGGISRHVFCVVGRFVVLSCLSIRCDATTGRGTVPEQQQRKG